MWLNWTVADEFEIVFKQREEAKNRLNLRFSMLHGKQRYQTSYQGCKRLDVFDESRARKITVIYLKLSRNGVLSCIHFSEELRIDPS